MPKFVFGKSVDYIFVPTIDGEPLKVDSLVNAYIYSDEPTEAQIDNGTGQIGSAVTTWKDEGDYAKKITFPALTDDDEHSSEDYESYWVVVKFKYDSGGATKFVKELIHVYRPDALTSRITTQYPDVYALEPRLEDFKSPGDIEVFIAQAKKRVFRRYRGLGLERRRMFNLEELNDATQYLATALACMSLYSQNSPQWKDKFDMRHAEYDEIFAATQVGYDVDGDGAPAADEHANTSNTVYLIR